jgi:hypothetical protein
MKILSALMLLSLSLVSTLGSAQGNEESTVYTAWTPTKNQMIATIRVGNTLGAFVPHPLERLASEYLLNHPQDFEETVATIGGYSPFPIFTATLLDIPGELKMTLTQSFDLGRQSYLRISLSNQFDRVKFSSDSGLKATLSGEPAKAIFDVMKRLGATVQQNKKVLEGENIEMISYLNQPMDAMKMLFGTRPNGADIQCVYVAGGIFASSNEYLCFISDNQSLDSF